MKLSKARNLYLICVLAVAVCVGGMSSCKNEKKDSRGQIDKKAVEQIGFYETYKYLDIAQDISNLFETAGNPTLFRSNGNYDGPAVCAAQKRDTAAINAIIGDRHQWLWVCDIHYFRQRRWQTILNINIQ